MLLLCAMAAGCATQRADQEPRADAAEIGTRDNPYRWEVTAYNLDYGRYAEVLNYVYPVIFDATLLEEVPLEMPRGPERAGRRGVMHYHTRLKLSVDSIWHGSTRESMGLRGKDPQVIYVIVNDVAGNFPSGPGPYFNYGYRSRYRFFCDAPTLDKVIRVGASHIWEDDKGDQPR
jgi:hypothetical protein